MGECGMDFAGVPAFSFTLTGGGAFGGGGGGKFAGRSDIALEDAVPTGVRERLVVPVDVGCLGCQTRWGC